MPTYTGLKARIYGTIYGSLLALVGISGSLFFLTMLGVLPSMLQQVVVDLTPITSKLATLTPRRTVPLALFVILSLGTAVIAGIGLKEIGEVLFKDDYSIELHLGGAPGGGGGV